MGKIVVGCWDCDCCGADRISGEIKVCPNCGKPRGKDVTFYMAGPKTYVEDPDKVSKNPDWLCSFCDTLNADESKFCTSCGASREASEMNYFEVKRKQEEEARRKKEEERREAQKMQSSSASSSSGRSSGRPVLLFVLIAFAAVMIFMMMPKKKGMHVDSKAWERVISVESLQPVKDSGWTLPEDSWDVTSREEIYAYNQVLDHYETRERQVAEQVLDGYDVTYTYQDLGNGHFEEIEHQTPRYRTEYHTEYYEEPVYLSIPVYETKYYYTINKWLFDREEKTSGTDDEPYFAQLNLTETEREAGRSESYQIISGDKTYSVTYDLWQQIDTGSDISAKTRSGWIVSLE